MYTYTKYIAISWEPVVPITGCTILTGMSPEDADIWLMVLNTVNIIQIRFAHQRTSRVLGDGLSAVFVSRFMLNLRAAAVDRDASLGSARDPSCSRISGIRQGVGIIIAIGAHPHDSTVQLGDRVRIKWLADSCLDCELCRKGLEQSCTKGTYSGFTVDGTFSQHVLSYVRHVTPIPENMDSAEAASILCDPLEHRRLDLPGAGGGLGHLAVQYAAAIGLRVLAVDTGAQKKELVMKLGAEAWVDFRETKDLVSDIRRATGGDGSQTAVMTTATSTAYEQANHYLRSGGKLIIVELPARTSLNADILFTVVKSISIFGYYVRYVSARI
ncbi:GroES-like protein [Phanerochaete sordida]|uniref:alcohol dehydrogenase n=1 Tax=Phanerochaete sordida TaxID=48140 RepID=A0A9P3L8U7_9APHY|nr:GroES-like protein [Phanerochaete sordida]